MRLCRTKDNYIIGTQFVDISSEDRYTLSDVIEKMNLYLILESALKGGASDIHLTIGKPPMVRKDGKILSMATEALVEGQVEAMLYPLLNKEQIEKFEKTRELDFAFSPDIHSRFRVNMHWQKGFAEASLRNIPTQVKNFLELGLQSQMMQNFCNEKAGLILIAGTTGAGKTTTMSAMVEHINKVHEKVVITVEDPIEYTFKSEKSVIKQRELGSDTYSYSDALRHVLRQDPDIICIGELLDGDCLLSAMRAAETGHLVVSTIHATNTKSAVERAVNFFPPEHALNIRQLISSCLVGILYQVLVPTIEGGRVMASELLLNNNAVKNLIREGKYSQIDNILQTGRSQGMYMLKHSLDDLFAAGVITEETKNSFTVKEYSSGA